MGRLLCREIPGQHSGHVRAGVPAQSWVLPSRLDCGLGTPCPLWFLEPPTWPQCQAGSRCQQCPPPPTLGPRGAERQLCQGNRERRGGGGDCPWAGGGAAGLRALSDQRAQYFIAGNRSQDINYLGRAALKAF